MFEVGKFEGKTSPTRTMHGWEDNFKVDLTKKQNIIVRATFIWFKIRARDEYCNIPSDSTKGEKFLDQLSNY
jgi:hypothetical protein